MSERAKALGLAEISEIILYGKQRDFRLLQFVNKEVEGLKDINQVVEGITHILAQSISKDADVRMEIKRLLVYII